MVEEFDLYGPEVSSFLFCLLQVWFSNVPHTELASYKSDQNWVKVSENKQKLIFPGGGTQFKTEHGALHYIEYIQKVLITVHSCFTISGFVNVGLVNLMAC